MSHIPASCDHFWRSYVVAKLENFQWIFRKSHFGRFMNVGENGILASKNLGFWRNHFFASLFFRKCFLCSWLLESKRVSADENHFWSFYNTLKFGISIFSEFLENVGNRRMAQFLYHLLHSSMYKIEKSLFHKKYYFHISFWTTLIMIGFWCECPNSFPSDLGHF